MIEKIVNQGKKFFGPARVWVRRAAAVVFLAMFLLGYNLSTSEIQQCSAQVVPAAPTPGVAGGTCAPAANCTGTTCEPPNTAEDMAFFLVLDFRQKLISAATALENFLYQLVNDMLKSEYIQVLWLEQEMIDWLNTMWSYNLLPMR